MAGFARKKCQDRLVNEMRIIRNILESALLEMKGGGIYRDRMPTLILDNMNTVVEGPEGKEVLSLLQSFGKEMADARLLNLVFSSSDGRVMDMMYENSAASRMAVFPFMYDLPIEDARSYLECICHNVGLTTRKDSITELVDIVGGRFVHLQLTFSLLEQYKSDINVFKVKRRLFSLVSKEFENLGIQLPPKCRLLYFQMLHGLSLRSLFHLNRERWIFQCSMRC